MVRSSLNPPHCGGTIPAVSNAAGPIARIRPGERLRVVNRTRGGVLVRELRLALDAWRRLRGLLGGPPLAEAEGLLLRPCRGVHTCFMRYAIDVLFLDEEGRVVEVLGGLRPFRFSRLVPEACAALELPSGAAARGGVRAGDVLAFEARGAG